MYLDFHDITEVYEAPGGEFYVRTNTGLYQKAGRSKSRFLKSDGDVRPAPLFRRVRALPADCERQAIDDPWPEPASEDEITEYKRATAEKKKAENTPNDRAWWVRLWKRWHYKRCRYCNAWLTMAYCTQERAFNHRVEWCRPCERENNLRRGEEFYRLTGKLPI